MDSKHHCNDCPHWYVTKKKYPSGYYKITLCKKYNEQLYYLAGEENQTPHPCNTCSKRFSYMPYIEKKFRGDGRMTERLNDKNPCNDCRLYNPCTGPCDKWHEWNSSVLSKLAEYETAEEEGRLVVLPKCKIGDTVYLPIDFQNKIYTGEIEGFEYSKMRNAWVVKIRTDDEGTCYEAFEDFGKTVFFSREEAEKALDEMEKSD